MENTRRIYLDYAATTPVDERVVQAMLPIFNQNFGNPSSVHFFGQKAEAVVTHSRKQIASWMNARSDEIFFTSGGTESNNLALRGTMLALRNKKKCCHVLVSEVEHHAVLHTARQAAEQYGFELELIPVDEFGRVSPEEVRNLIRPETVLVSVIYANNEIGTINPIREIAAVCREKNVLFHTDAVQAAAHLAINVALDGVDLLTFGAHKFYGPKGVGGLFVRRGTRIIPVNTGGGQESDLRAGTENVPYILGMAEAYDITRRDMEAETGRITGLRDYLIKSVLENAQKVKLTGHPEKRLPNHASFVFEDVDGNHLLTLLDAAGFACSSGSACKAGSPKPSEVLIAMGFSKKWNKGSLRVTLGRQTRMEEVELFCNSLPEIVEKARAF
jgi:cysteine desulfurase